MTILLSIFGLAVASYLALLGWLYLNQSRYIYSPTTEIVSTPDQHGLRYESVSFQAADGVYLHGWFVPSDKSDFVILFFHGNTGNISDRIETLAIFADLGLSSFIVDYRGYGQSEGRPSEQGTYLDAEAAWRLLTENRGIPADHIIVLGRSLGAAIASRLATLHTPKAMVLESTFTSAPEIAALHHRFIPARLLTRFRYDVLNNVRNIACPIMIVHSPDDEVIPYDHGQRIFAAANAPKEFLAIQGRHNDGFNTSGQAYIDGLRNFLARYVTNSAEPGG